MDDDYLNMLYQSLCHSHIDLLVPTMTNSRLYIILAEDKYVSAWFMYMQATTIQLSVFIIHKSDILTN